MQIDFEWDKMYTHVVEQLQKDNECFETRTQALSWRYFCSFKECVPSIETTQAVDYHVNLSGSL